MTVAALAVLAACGNNSGTATAPTTAASTVDTTAGPAATTAVGFTPKPIAWQACAPEGYDCAFLEVPLNYDKPDGTRIKLAVKRKPAEDQAKRIGSLFFNPGGPGGSGVIALPRLVDDFAPEVRARFDIVSWDPRGVGGSAPLSCDRGAIEFYANDLSSTHPGPEADAAAKKWADLCKTSNGDELPYLGTTDVMKDLEVMRQAVGDEKLTYAGFSYGTLIGLLYADRYPEKTRAIILDGVVDPSLDVKESTIQQSTAVDDAYERFLAWCKVHPGDGENDCPIAADPEGTIKQVIDQARTDPLPGKVGTETVELSTTFVNFAITTATYDSAIWPQIGHAIKDMTLSDPAGLAKLANAYIGAASQSLNAAVNCLDSKAPTGDAFQALVDETALAAPKLGVYNANSVRVCKFWSVPPKPLPTTFRAAGSPPILVWGTTGDNATPYANSVKISGMLENATLVTLEASRHAALGANECVTKIQATYLIDVKVPPADTKC